MLTTSCQYDVPLYFPSLSLVFLIKGFCFYLFNIIDFLIDKGLFIFILLIHIALLSTIIFVNCLIYLYLHYPDLFRTFVAGSLAAFAWVIGMVFETHPDVLFTQKHHPSNRRVKLLWFVCHSRQ